MAVPRPVKYPLDYSGMSPNNLVTNEPHTLSAQSKRVFVPKYGPFFTDGAVLVDLATGLPLAPRTQYLAIQLEEEASVEAGKEICSAVVVIDPTVSPNVVFTYQTLGGPLSYSIQAILDLIAALDLDSRPVTWAEIVGKPDRFPPSPHPHPLTDVYGWHKMFPALEAIERAILTSDQAQFDAIRAQFQAIVDRIDADLTSLNDRFTAHENDFNNPHRLHIHDIDGLLESEINQLLAQRLPIDGTAVNSAKLENRTFAQVRDQTIAAIQNPQLVNGLLPRQAVGSNWEAGRPELILSAQGWMPFESFYEQYNKTAGVYFAGQNSLGGVAATYADQNRYPEGTMVSFWARGAYSQGTGNGSITIYYLDYYIALRTAPTSWRIVASYRQTSTSGYPAP